MNSAYGPNYRHYEHYDRRVYGRPHYGLNPPPRAASIHAASSVHSFSRRSGGTLMRAGVGADAQSTVMREERRRRAKTRCLVTIGVLLPAMAGIIGVVAYAVSAENYGRTPLNQRPASGGTRSGLLADPEVPRRRTSSSAENRMDTFEAKSASNQVPVRQLPPRRREPDLEKEPQINALNPGPTANVDDTLTKPWQGPRQRIPSAQSESNRFSGKVYFDKEQADVPLRHGDGTPEEELPEPRQKHFHQADPPYTQRVRPDLALPRLAATAVEHPSPVIQPAAPELPVFVREPQTPHVSHGSKQMTDSQIQQLHPVQTHHHQHHHHRQQQQHQQLRPVGSHQSSQDSSPVSRTSPLSPSAMSIPAVADGQHIQQQQHQQPMLSPPNNVVQLAPEVRQPAGIHQGQPVSSLVSSPPQTVATRGIQQAVPTITVPVVQAPQVPVANPGQQTVIVDTSQQGSAFDSGAIPTGMREQQITVVDNASNKGYVIHFLVGDNDRNPDGTVSGFDPNSPAFQDYIREIIRQQQDQEEQESIQTIELSPAVISSSTTSSTAAPVTERSAEPSSTSTTTTTTSAPSTTTKATTTTTTTTTSTTEAPTSTTTTSTPASTATRTSSKRPTAASPSKRNHRPLAERIPPIRPRVQARFPVKTTTAAPAESAEYDDGDDGDDEEHEQDADPSDPDEAANATEGQHTRNNSQERRRVGQNVSVNTPRFQRQPSPPKPQRRSEVPMMTSASTAPRNIARVKYVPPPMIIEPAPPSQVSSDHLQPRPPPSPRMTTAAPVQLPSTTTTRRPRPPGPKPIFYSEANRRDTTHSSQNPFRPPSPVDYPQTNRPGQPPTQMFSSTKQHATFANAPFRPPSPPRTPFLGPVGGVPGFEPQLIAAESQLGGLAGVHVLPDGGLLLPAPQLTPQYPPTVAIPPPPPSAQAVPGQTNRPKRRRKLKGGKKSKKPKKDRYGIEIGGGSHGHDDDDEDGGSGITLSLGGGGGGDRKHVSPLSIAKHIFLPFLPKPKVNLNGRVVFGVVLENAAKFGHKKLHPDEEPQAVADISLNGHTIHDHS